MQILEAARCSWLWHTSFINVLLQIVGNKYDSIVDEVKKDEKVFESFSALLDNVSPMYRLQFGMAISEKLKHLVDDDNQWWQGPQVSQS